MSRKLAISFLIAIFLTSSYFVFAVDRQEGTPPDGDIAVTFCEEGFVNKLVQSESKNRYEYQCIPTSSFCSDGEEPVKIGSTWECRSVDITCDNENTSFVSISEDGTAECSTFRATCGEDEALVKISANEFSCEDVALLPKCDLRETIQLSISGGEKTFTCVEGIFNKNVENPDCFREKNGDVSIECLPIDKDIDIIFDADTESKEIKGTGTFERIKVKLNGEIEYTAENYPRNVPCGYARQGDTSITCLGNEVGETTCPSGFVHKKIIDSYDLDTLQAASSSSPSNRNISVVLAFCYKP